MTQRDAVIRVMEENGGYATLVFLYEKALQVPGVKWNTKTPYATICRIVQDSRFFFKVKPGLWALNSCRDKLPREIISLLDESAEETERAASGRQSAHSYYQGLLVQIGNFEGYETYVPPQDRNKVVPGLNQKLGELIKISDFPSFTYQDILQRVKFIDVFWFNKSGFPARVFEIENTTDFSHALARFVELQDFRVQMYIVAPKERYQEFQDRLAYRAFNPVKNSVCFLSYDEVAVWHENSYKLYRTRPTG